MKNKLLNWLIIIVGIGLIINLSRSIIELSGKSGIVEESERRVAEAEEKNARLREQYRAVRREEYIEKIAREKLGLGKTGEIAVVLPKSAAAGAGKNKAEQTKTKQTIWEKLFELLARF